MVNQQLVHDKTKQLVSGMIKRFVAMKKRYTKKVARVTNYIGSGKSTAQ